MSLLAPWIIRNVFILNTIIIDNITLIMMMANNNDNSDKDFFYCLKIQEIK